jgi:retinol dehydrogenase 12
MFAKSFDPDRDIPSLAGKVILITGGNDGIGRQTSLELAKHGPTELWIAARNAKKSQQAIDDIQEAAPGVTVRFLKLDLADFDSIKSAAKTFLDSASRLDFLVENAGLMGSPAAVTKQGHEITLGTNHVGHALLVKLLLPLLLSTAEQKGSDVRVVILSSRGHNFGPGLVFDSFKAKDSEVSIIYRYTQSKLANVVYARALARRYPQFTTVSINPGDVKTSLYDSGNLGLKMNILRILFLPFFAKSQEDGAKNTLWACISKETKTGEYYEPVGVGGKASQLSQDDKLADRLWEWTEKELAGHEI